MTNPYEHVAEHLIVRAMHTVKVQNNIAAPLPDPADVTDYLQNGGVCTTCAFLAQVPGAKDCPACMMRAVGL